MGYGSTVAAGMFIIITVISLVTLRIINGKEEA
jgi:raffinose/stachyose/melibiose transport system permease protein